MHFCYDREMICRIWLHSAPALSLNGIKKLTKQYGSAQALWNEFSSSCLDVAGESAYRQLAKMRKEGEESILDPLYDAGIYAVTPEMSDYPVRLKNIPDPPELLFVKGKLPQEETPALSVIGARRDTRYGRDQTYKIVHPLAGEGVQVISGLARGIDTAAHEAALRADGYTAAVLGNGLLSVYPPENKTLADRIIAAGGALISEFAPTAEPLPYHFPIRNRIISGLSDALLLIEARLKSGTASTVNHALRQGREVFALPGNVDVPGSELPLQLIQDGAQMAVSAESIVSAMGWRQERAQQKNMFETDEVEPQDPVLQALFEGEKSFTELMESTGMKQDALNIRLTMLELEGKIVRVGGGSYARRLSPLTR